MFMTLVCLCLAHGVHADWASSYHSGDVTADIIRAMQEDERQMSSGLKAIKALHDDINGMNATIISLNSTVFEQSTEVFTVLTKLTEAISAVEDKMAVLEDRLSIKIQTVEDELGEKIIAAEKETEDKINVRFEAKSVNCGNHNAEDCYLCPRVLGWPHIADPYAVTNACLGDCNWCLGLCQPIANKCPVTNTHVKPLPYYNNPRLNYNPAQAVRPVVQNSGKDCWIGCNNQPGKCNWCGVDGWCCRQGWIENGCDGKIGGPTYHQCVLKPSG